MTIGTDTMDTGTTRAFTDIGDRPVRKLSLRRETLADLGGGTLDSGVKGGATPLTVTATITLTIAVCVPITIITYTIAKKCI